MPELVHDLLFESAERSPQRAAVVCKNVSTTYAELAELVSRFSAFLSDTELKRYDRIAVFLPKMLETVVTVFGAAHSGKVFVPINPLLKPRQVAHILGDCMPGVLVTSFQRARDLANVLVRIDSLHAVVIVDEGDESIELSPIRVLSWKQLVQDAGTKNIAPCNSISSDVAAIFYTSGSTGVPKGVILSHRNIVVGATSVASYIENCASDRILAALPLSFDAGFSQVTTGLYSGAAVILHDYFLPRDLIRIAERERVTGITGVPPLWIQLAELNWSPGAVENMRYFANTGGKMPRKTLDRLRSIFPSAKPYLMYGLTEAFRSTYLSPSEVDRRPDSIGKAIPNVEIAVVGADGNLCKPGQTGELVHRGPLVSMGYWNDPEKTAERFRPSPSLPVELPISEIAVWSGDMVKIDEEGFLYFVGRKDSMIKTSGYRVSPTEIEDVAYASGLVAEAVALGIQDDKLGQSILLIASPESELGRDTDALLQYFRRESPAYMIPTTIEWRGQLPRNNNGKLDRVLLAQEHASRKTEGK